MENSLETTTEINEEINRQAQELERLLPIVTRQLFAADPTHPLSELPVGQFRLCTLLHKEGRRTMSQIGEDLGISVSAVTQMADRLEKAGLVERTSDTTGDRRSRHLRLTRQGREMMQSRMVSRLERTYTALGKMSPEERDILIQALENLRVASRGLGPVDMEGYPDVAADSLQPNRNALDPNDPRFQVVGAQ